MADEAAIEIVAAGAKYQIRMSDLTAADAGLFRKTLGIPLSAAFQEGNADIDVIAGLVWLVRRRANPTLAYASVAETLNYGNIEVGGKAEPAAEQADDSPEV